MRCASLGGVRVVGARAEVEEEEPLFEYIRFRNGLKSTSLSLCVPSALLSFERSCDGVSIAAKYDPNLDLSVLSDELGRWRNPLEILRDDDDDRIELRGPSGETASLISSTSLHGAEREKESEILRLITRIADPCFVTRLSHSVLFYWWKDPARWFTAKVGTYEPGNFPISFNAKDPLNVHYVRNTIFGCRNRIREEASASQNYVHLSRVLKSSMEVELARFWSLLDMDPPFFSFFE